MPLPAFHYIKHGRAFGPVTAADLLKLFADGVVGERDLVRAEGVTSWQPAQDVVESVRAGHVRSVPPPPIHSRRPGDAKDTVFTQAPSKQPERPRSRARRRKKCLHCAARTAADAAFCHRCGKDQSQRGCPSCGGTSPKHAKFCGQCGNAL
ncbi:MAG: GYF domain-containing protein [Myxococcales bacterium]|nr:GYF domain-containing protein [Myxococcales bacterium]